VWFRLRVNEQTTQKEISVSGGKKKGDRTKRAEIWSFWLLREPQFNLDHYELRYANPFGVTWSEKCSREVHRSRAQRRNSETTVKEELNATKIVFIRTCRKPRSNYPANPAKSPRRFHTTMESPPSVLRAYLAKTFRENPKSAGGTATPITI